MSQEDLRRALEQMHAELGRAGALDDATRERLEALQADVGHALDRSSGESLQERLRERLEDAIVEFEASHPELARRLATVIDTLAFYNL
jgi:signal transduction histidine kinase